MGWRTTWEWRIYYVVGYMARFDEYEIAPTTGGRIWEIHAARGGGKKVVGWAWEFFSIGGLF